MGDEDKKLFKLGDEDKKLFKPGYELNSKEYHLTFRVSENN